MSCKGNSEYRAFELCHWMDRITLELAVKYATKSGKLTLAQKINDHFIDRQDEQENHIDSHSSNEHSSTIRHRNISTRKSSISLENSSPSIDSMNKSNVPTTTMMMKSGPFQNPFRKKVTLQVFFSSLRIDID